MWGELRNRTAEYQDIFAQENTQKDEQHAKRSRYPKDGLKLS